MGLSSWFFKRSKLYKELLKSVGTQVYSEMLRYIQNRPAYPPDDILTYINKGYLFNPIVYSIVSFITQKASVIPWGVYEIKEEKALQLYKSATKFDFNTKTVKTKALVEIKDHDLSHLFVAPNALQGWGEFFEQVCGFKLITGNSYIHCIAPKNGVNKGKIREMWSLPSQIIKIVAGDKTEPIKGYQYLQRAELIPPEEVIHLRYWTPEYSGGAFLYGLSPLRAAKRVMTKSNDSYDAFTSSFQNMGAYGIITAATDESEFTVEQAEMIEESYRRKTGPRNWGKPLITAANLKWQQMGMSPVDLNIIESDKMDLRMLCNVYHISPELLGDSSNKTYSNMKEAGTAAYTNAIIPLLNHFRDSFNLFIRGKYEGKIYVDYDASMISELQEDLSQLTTALQGAWWLTLNEKRDMMNFGADKSSPLYDDYWIPMNLMPTSQPRINLDALEEVEKRLRLNDYGK